MFLATANTYDSAFECYEARDRLERQQDEIASVDAVAFCVKSRQRSGMDRFQVHLLVK